MSKENVEVVSRGMEHWMATGEFLGTPHADFVWDMSTFRGWPERQTYPGVEGFKQFNADWQDAWDDYEFEVEDYIDAGEQVVVIARQRGRSKATGIPVDMDLGQVWSMQGGQAIRMQMYASPGEALVAAGVQRRSFALDETHAASRPKRYADNPAASKASPRSSPK